MSKIELVAPCLFGIEALLANEIRNLGYDTSNVTDGRVTFWADEEGICVSNIHLRTAERVLVKVGGFEALTFEQLFEGVKNLPWADWISANAQFPVKGHSVNSKLASVPDCQSIIKKAIVESLKLKYRASWFEETQEKYQVQFLIMKNYVTLMIDTSGSSLHKRGYRENANAAPLRETIAAAMVILSKWSSEFPFIDPFCGSGTIPIEAALIGSNIAPGLLRTFAAESWNRIPKKLWWDVRSEAYGDISNEKLRIIGSDIDPASVKLSRYNASLANVDDRIRFEQKDALTISKTSERGYIVCNPPYGERLLDKVSAEEMYSKFSNTIEQFTDWRVSILSSHENFEQYFGKKANKKRKLYNGMLRCNLFQYF